jgi:hypothetical protein
VVKDLYVDHGQWDEMAKALARSIRMEVTSIRSKHSRRSYFYCLGNPIYRNPMLQQKEMEGQELVLSQLPVTARPPRTLLADAKQAAEAVMDYRITERVLATSVTEQQVTEVASAVKTAIDYAAALDLERRPRLSRTNAGKLFLAAQVSSSRRR